MNLKKILNNAKKIAVVRTDKIGDMVLTLPMCNAIKKLYPNKELTLIANNYVMPLVENSYAFNKVLYINDFKNGIKDIFKAEKYDIVFYPRPRFDECKASFFRVKLRVGTAYRWYSFLFNHKIHDHRKRGDFHEAEYNCRLVESVVGEKVEVQLVKPYIKKELISNIEKDIKNIFSNDYQEYFIIHPGTGGSAFDWSPENFGLCGKLIYNKTKINAIITGTKSEIDKCEIVRKNFPEAINLAGQYDLSHLIALISKSKLLIANSTGILHIAASLDIHVVGLYPNTSHLSARRWGPYSKNSKVVSPPLDGENIDDMSLIKPEIVVNEAVKILLKK